MLLFDLPKLVLITSAALAVGGVTGFVGGCQHAKDAQAKQQLAEVKENARLEKKDGAIGANAVAALRKEEETRKELARQLLGPAAKPLVIVKAQPANCPAQVASPQNSQVAATAAEVTNETAEPVVYFSPYFMWMYDVSAQPGNAKLRTGTYETPGPLTVDEGRQIFVRNNLQCNEWREQLDTLITRIEQKKEIFKQKGVQ